MEYSESLEMYLKAILELSAQSKAVHSVDVAAKLSVSKPSVNRALGILKSDGYIHHERYGSIVLTAEGRARAEEVLTRHDDIYRYLIAELGLDPAVAERDACRMEHILSPETLQAIRGRLKGAR
jgi:DtxR family Mn-dependent transcriptional regulator